MTKHFQVVSNYKPAGDQPRAINEIVEAFGRGEEDVTLLGATGTGKTFTVANVIEEIQKPTLVIAHNKTLAAQLAQEYREFFPNNAVHYFVSYYDYYQPEAYMPVSDTYIEKEAMINEEIERLRHASTQALLTRNDVIIVASVSCIYGLGSPEEYEKKNFRVDIGAKISRGELVRHLIDVYFSRTNADLTPGTFRALGNSVEIMPVNERSIYRFKLLGSSISSIEKIDATTREIIETPETLFIFPAKHFVTEKDKLDKIISKIEEELKTRVKDLEKEGKVLEIERLKRRTKHDLALIKEIGYCNGIENYSRHFTGRNEGEPPNTLLSYFPHKEDGTPDFMTVVDESHVTIPQIGGMYGGDRSRKETLVEYGFRLPSAKDNRPLKFDEFEKRVNPVLYVSATPGPYERERSTTIAEQVIRPTGLVDPKIDVRAVTGTSDEEYPGQIKDFINEAEAAIEKGERVIATTLTKKMAEDLSEYLKERGLKSEYLHSEIKTIDRIDTITNFRRGEFDVLVGVNLLREGLDLPELALIGILDADKEGFLRSQTSLLQIIGRAARNVNGRVILYADRVTESMQKAIDETDRRREIQLAFNKEHGITPKTIEKNIHDIAETMRSEHDKAVEKLVELDRTEFNKNPRALIKEKRRRMDEAVKDLDFETAAILRDEIYALEKEMK
ncbi:MAG: excinuclease ABC subunit UvrB [Candidatus Campbellbacteria bacterium]|nr:excinuclease ABC subunit UvrB [Candidatus Campbellbacteria bacterium]